MEAGVRRLEGRVAVGMGMGKICSLCESCGNSMGIIWEFPQDYQ